MQKHEYSDQPAHSQNQKDQFRNSYYLSDNSGAVSFKVFVYFSANGQEIPFYSLFCLSLLSQHGFLKKSLIVQSNQVTNFISRSLHAICHVNCIDSK